MGTHVWEFRLSIQVCVWVLTFNIHIQVVRFRYSDSGIQVWNSDLGIQDWVYRLADKYKALTFSIHIQGIQVYNAGLGVQTCLYTKALTVFTFRVFRFTIQVWVYRLACIPKHSQYSHSGIQVWVYRLADKYKALTFSIHIQGIQVYNSGLGVQTCLYIQACIPKPECLNVNT